MWCACPTRTPQPGKRHPLSRWCSARPESRGNRTGPGADLCHTPVRVMTHYDARGVAGQALRRSSWNAQAVLEHGLPRLGRVGQDGGVDMEDDLVALAGNTGIDAAIARGLSQECERVGLLLHCRLLRLLLEPPLVQALPGRFQRLQQEGADLWSQASTDRHGPVFIWIHMHPA